MRRPKTIPAIEPNAGLKVQLQKRIVGLIRAQTALAAAEVLNALIDSGNLVDGSNMAQDAGLSKKALERIDKEVRTYKAAHPDAAAGQVDAEVAKRLARWMISVGEKAKEVSKWFVRAAAQNVTASQRRALVRAGISPRLLREKWSVPVVKNRFISETAAKQLPQLIDDMTALITKMQANDLARLRETIAEGLLKGQNIGDIENALSAATDFTEARAKRVALDQSVKINQGIQRANAQELGLDTAIWVHVPGRYSSRETHIAMDGKRFNLQEGLYDSDVDKKVVPGMLPFCRCCFRLDIQKLLDR